SGSCFTNSNLPLLFLKGRKWAKTYLPTLLLWLRDQPNVWSVPEGDLVHALMEITKVVYPTFTTLDDICLNMPIFSVVCCLFFCNTILMSFAYEDLDSHSPEKAFCGAFILQLLANTHLCSCAGSVDVPALGLAPKPYMVRGAIGLCVAAVSYHYYIGIKLILLMHDDAARACHQAGEVQVHLY
ncbi:hypothetical protein PISMIDRAFT_119610, partial [Pisolithus microcarpus 441]